VDVSTPGITLFSLPATVGAGLQDGAFLVRLGATNHGGVTVHLVSSDPSRVVLAANNSSVGSASLDLPVANGQTDANYWIQAIEGTTGAVTVTASATGFTGASGTVNVVQPAIQITAVPTSIAATAASVLFNAQVGLPNSSGTGIASFMQVRAGSSIVATVTNSAAAVAQLVTSAGGAQSRSVVIAGGSSSSPSSLAAGGIQFDPLSAGQTTVNVTSPGFAIVNTATVNVTVTP